MDVLVMYDISDTGKTGASRLKQIADVCTRYGQRVQFSVFECRLSKSRLARLIGEIEDVIDRRRDSVIIYCFQGSIEESKLRFGRNKAHKLGRPWLL